VEKSRSPHSSALLAELSKHFLGVFVTLLSLYVACGFVLYTWFVDYI